MFCDTRLNFRWVFAFLIQIPDFAQVIGDQISGGGDGSLCVIFQRVVKMRIRAVEDEQVLAKALTQLRRAKASS